MKTVLFAGILFAAAACSAGAQEARMYDDRPKIAVNGSAVVNAKPDKILVTFGIETSDKDIVLAKRKNNAIMRGAVAAIRKAGVPKKEIQTDHLSIEPRYRNYRPEGFLGYFVRNTLVVTLADTRRLEGLVTDVLGTGVNYIHKVDFQTTEFKKLREQARELALRTAKEKAERMAAVLGEKVGAPLRITESYSGSPWWYYSSWGGWGGGRGHGMAQNVVQAARGGSGEITDTVALGKIAVRANVSVTFELEK